MSGIGPRMVGIDIDLPELFPLGQLSVTLVPSFRTDSFLGFLAIEGTASGAGLPGCAEDESRDGEIRTLDLGCRPKARFASRGKSVSLLESAGDGVFID